jgi:hypothetical protein
MSNVPDFVIQASVVLAVAGLAIGFWASTRIKPLVVVGLGAAFMSPVLYVIAKQAGSGCAGGECAGVAFVLLFLAPPAIVGAGLSIAGLTLSLWRTLRRVR